MAKGRYYYSRGGGFGKVLAVILALVILAGIPIVGYCSRIDGKWFANGNPTTWRWGGIWTEQEDEGAHNHGASALAAPIKPNPGISGANDCPSCGAFNTFYYNTITAASCTTAGKEGYICSSCAYRESETTIPALGHSYAWVITSTTTESYQCTRCSDVSETRAHTHSYAWVTTAAPTQETEGEESYKCACGDVTETRILPTLKEPVELPPDPVKDGYTFTGWYFDEECTQPYDGRVIYEDTVLYAGWQINTFTVTFDSKGGSYVAAQTIDWNTSATLSTPERIGYRFLGWFLSGDVQYVDQPITEDVTLTAHWERVQCTVSFYVDGVLYTSLTVDYGTPLIKVAESIGLFAANLYAYDYLEGGDTDGEITQIKVTADMTVTAGEPTAAEKVQNAVQNYWLYAAVGLAGVLALGLLGLVIFKRRR